MDDSKNNVPSFIGKLALILKDRTATPYVTWSPAGDSVIVVDPPTFATQVLPRSLVRRLPMRALGGCCVRQSSARIGGGVFERNGPREQVLQAQQLCLVCAAAEPLWLPQDLARKRIVRIFAPHLQVLPQFLASRVGVCNKPVGFD